MAASNSRFRPAASPLAHRALGGDCGDVLDRVLARAGRHDFASQARVCRAWARTGASSEPVWLEITRRFFGENAASVLDRGGRASADADAWPRERFLDRRIENEQWLLEADVRGLRAMEQNCASMRAAVESEAESLRALRVAAASAERGECSWTQAFYSALRGHGIAGSTDRARACIHRAISETEERHAFETARCDKAERGCARSTRRVDRNRALVAVLRGSLAAIRHGRGSGGRRGLLD